MLASSPWHAGVGLARVRPHHGRQPLLERLAVRKIVERPGRRDTGVRSFCERRAITGPIAQVGFVARSTRGAYAVKIVFGVMGLRNHSPLFAVLRPARRMAPIFFQWLEQKGFLTYVRVMFRQDGTTRDIS
jgi:hypothetical protein